VLTESQLLQFEWRMAPLRPLLPGEDGNCMRTRKMLCSMTKEVVTIITTVALGEDAARIAEMLVRDRLAACVQEITIQSRYRWKDEIRCEPEVLLLVKTARDRAEAAVTAIRKIHPYELPESSCYRLWAVLLATHFRAKHAA
jgi:periplasmic divalent cation tolerance protein